MEVIEKFAARVKRRLVVRHSLSLTACAASLAYHGLLGKAEDTGHLCLEDLDLITVPTEHLTALASWVTSSCEVSIDNIIGIDKVSFMKSLKCGVLWMNSQSLEREETLAFWCGPWN